MGPLSARNLGGPSSHPMPPGNVTVNLTTHRGVVFTGVSSCIELRTTDGVIAITPGEDSYLSMIHSTEITLRIGNAFKTFTLKNAAASLRSGHLTVLAEEIQATETPVA